MFKQQYTSCVKVDSLVNMGLCRYYSKCLRNNLRLCFIHGGIVLLNVKFKGWGAKHNRITKTILNVIEVIPKLHCKRYYHNGCLLWCYFKTGIGPISYIVLIQLNVCKKFAKIEQDKPFKPTILTYGGVK